MLSIERIRVVSLFAIIGALSLRAQPAIAQSPSAGERARMLYREGSVAFERHEYDRALGLFTQGYALSKKSGFLFNMAESARLTGDKSLAHQLYVHYLTEAKPGAQTADALLHCRELGVGPCQAEAARPASPPIQAPVLASPPIPVEKPLPPAPPPIQPVVARFEIASPDPSPHRASQLRVAGLVVGGLAIAAAVVGISVYAQAYADFGTLRDQTCRARPCTASDGDSVVTMADAGYALLGVAGAFAVADVVIWILQTRAQREAPKLALTPRTDGIGLTLSGSF
jgi:hypothetical protein